jgi:ATP/ADP translocase
MSRPWFRTWGWIYRPVAWPGVVPIALAFFFSIQVFLAVDRASHSVSDTLYGIFPYVVPCWILVYWVASKTSSPQA